VLTKLLAPPVGLVELLELELLQLEEQLLRSVEANLQTEQ
jgi:hypothetical protein